MALATSAAWLVAPQLGPGGIFEQRKSDLMIAVPAPQPDPLSAHPQWGLSVLDGHAHAVDVSADHPDGVYVARCGHRLVVITRLHDEPPTRMCPACDRWSRK